MSSLTKFRTRAAKKEKVGVAAEKKAFVHELRKWKPALKEIWD